MHFHLCSNNAASIRFKILNRLADYKSMNRTTLIAQQIYTTNKIINIHKYYFFPSEAFKNVSKTVICLNNLLHAEMNILLDKTGNSNGDIAIIHVSNVKCN